MQMRDELGTFYTDEEFADLYSKRGQPGESPWRLALIQIFAYLEELSDERAADAMRSRIDWKYALSLELSDSGFDAAVLSEFRTRLVAGGAEVRLFEKMVEQLRTAGYVKARGRQRTDATHVLASVRAINRLVLVGETMRQALNVVATSASAWLQPHIQPDWLARYEKRVDEYRLPKAKAKRDALASQIGEDGRTLLQALAAKELLPAEHLMDAGYVDSEFLVESLQQHQITVIGPVAPDSSWQALSPDAYDSARFQIDWEAHSATCPQGHQSRKWSATQDKLDNAIINIRFAPQDCLACPARALCTRSQDQPRNLTIRPQAQHEFLQRRRQEQATPAFQQAYTPRAGVEGTLSQAVRNTDLRRSRYLGLAKTTLHTLFSAAALNLYRITDWLAQRPRALTRTSAFARLAALPT